MTKSNYIFEQGDAIEVGAHGEHNYVFAGEEEVTDNAVSNVVFESGTGLGGGRKLWYCTGGNNANDSYELDPGDFSIIQNVDYETSKVPDGIGGKFNVVWFNDTDNNNVEELSSEDLSTVRQANSPNSAPDGMGGDANIVWHGQGGDEILTELSAVDLSVVRQEPLADDNFGACGGSTDVIYVCGTYSGTAKVSEYDTNDLSKIREGSSPSDGPNGIGGTTDYMYVSTINGGYELAPSDFSVINSGSLSNAADNTGIGA